MTTVLDELVKRIRGAASYNRHDIAEPRVVLWPDGDQLWSTVVPLLQDAMPELLVLDPAGSGPRRGPATLVRYLLAQPMGGDTPIVYLPGVSRQSFRGAAGFPDSARHLFALQYLGQFWEQRSGKDWTPFAFLSSMEGGLSLEVARDEASKAALAAQLENTLRAPLAQLTGKRLEATDFFALATADPIRSLLLWMSSPESAKAGWSVAEWNSFCGIAKQEFGLDPARDGVLTAAERLAEGPSAAWNRAWDRYRESPRSYAGVRERLAQVVPTGLFAAHDERLPRVNEAREGELRLGLLGLGSLPEVAARSRLTELCHAHAPRMKWVWSALGGTPLAEAAFYLGVMTKQMAAGFAGDDWDSVAANFTADGWRVDGAAWRAFASARMGEDAKAVTVALRAVYLPWLEMQAERLQGFTTSYPNTTPLDAWTLAPEAGSVILFVDGLRFDLGQELQRLLKSDGLDVTLEHRWSALPTVTATAKPAWVPLAGHLNGNDVTAGFEPSLSETGKPLKTAEFRRMLDTIGWTWTDPREFGDPSQSAWTETGSFDHYGHDIGARLAWRIEEELDATVIRVRELLRQGWKKVVIVTDHGWLLLPGGLPKVDLPKHLTVSRWGRCAVPEPGAQHGFPQTSWFWGGEHPIVLSPGISVFQGGMEYAHGGLSLQEALTPVLTVMSNGSSGPPSVSIESVKWVGLRLVVKLAGDMTGVVVDVRTKAADSTSSVLVEPGQTKAPDETGTISLPVEGDNRLGEAALVVVLKAGAVVAKRPVTIGGD